MPSMTSIGFGFIPRMGATACVELAQVGEQMGFTTCWLADQTFYYDPFTLLGAVAAATKEIGLGIAVTNPFSRHPAQIARSCQTLAALSQGRFALGIGAGNRKELLSKLDIPQRHSPERTGSAVDLIRQLLQGETVNSNNPYFPMTEVALESPTPVEVPLLVAARGSRMLAMAGEVSDGAIVECLLTKPAIAWAREQLAVGSSRAGRDKEDLHYVAWGVGLVVDSYDEVPQDVRNMVGHLIAIMPDDLIQLLGLDLEKIRQLRSDYAEGGPPAVGKYIGKQELSAVTFVGTADSLNEKIDLLRACDVDHIAFLLMGKTGAENRQMLEKFAQQIEALA